MIFILNFVRISQLLIMNVTDLIKVGQTEKHLGFGHRVQKYESYHLGNFKVEAKSVCLRMSLSTQRSELQ